MTGDLTGRKNYRISSAFASQEGFGKVLQRSFQGKGCLCAYVVGRHNCQDFSRVEFWQRESTILDPFQRHGHRSQRYQTLGPPFPVYKVLIRNGGAYFVTYSLPMFVPTAKGA